MSFQIVTPPCLNAVVQVLPNHCLVQWQHHSPCLVFKPLLNHTKLSVGFNGVERRKTPQGGWKQYPQRWWLLKVFILSFSYYTWLQCLIYREGGVTPITPICCLSTSHVFIDPTGLVKKYIKNTLLTPLWLHHKSSTAWLYSLFLYTY